MVESGMAPYKFTEARQGEYLALLRAGHGRIFAARQCGVAPKTVAKFIKASPEFAEDVEEAEQEAAEPVEAKLYEAALAGDPWAVKEWLGKRMKGRWGDAPRKVEVSGVVEHSLESGLGRVLELQRGLEERAAALRDAGVVLDVESWEGDAQEAAGELPAAP